ncbi:MAG TPA: IS1595 family transposase, partial [Candidatus Angelobacter sp.]
IDVTKKFSTENKCLDYLEQMRWPNGLCCIHCGVMNVSKIVRSKRGKNQRTRIYQCLEEDCRKQFSATSGTIFNGSHLSLTKWFLAIAMICEAKKGMSACQLQRHLGVNYRTAWYMAHRIREAMQDSGDLLTGVVEADHTYLTPKKPRMGKPYVKKEKRDVVMGMIERGGRLRLVPVDDAKIEIAEAVLDRHVSADAVLQTDEHPTFSIIGKRKFAAHRMVNHSISYGFGDLHTNTISFAVQALP